jgi:hypothetical protein
MWAGNESERYVLSAAFHGAPPSPHDWRVGPSLSAPAHARAACSEDGS